MVDGDLHSRSLIASQLQRVGYFTEEVETGEEALAVVRRQMPAVVLLDVRLPGICGYETCFELRREFGRRLPIVFLSTDRNESFDRVAGLIIGADDYLTKPPAADELIVRLRALVGRRELGRWDGTRPAYGLSPRELQILGSLADGSSQGEIAATLNISPKTVATHVEHIFSKLGVHSRAQAVSLAYRDGLVAI